MKKKILITGGCGFIGTNLCIYLKKKHYLVYSLDNLSRKGSIYNSKLLNKLKIKNFNFDISNFKKIDSLPKFDIIIDCCAEAAVEVSRKDIDRVINTNLIGTINILKKAKKDNSKIIFLSSSRVNSIRTISKMFLNHDFKNQIKIKETINENFDTSSPKSIYGLTKHASEMFIEEFSFAFNLKYIINRLGVVSGPLQFGKQDQGFVSFWIWRHMIKKKLKYIGFGGFGNQVRDVLHIKDLCEIVEIQIKKFNVIYNKLFTIGGSSKNSISLKKLTLICQKITNNKIKFSKVKKTSIYDLPYHVSSNKAVSRAYNWKPKKDIYSVINDTHNWLVSKKKIIKKFM